METNPLKDQQALLHAIITSSDDAIVSKSLEGVITSWNPAAVRMFGYTQQEALGKHISIIIPSDRLGEEDFIISQIRAGKKVDHFETIRKTKNDTFLPISVTVSPVIDKTGKIIGASKIARDISDRQQAQKEKAQLLEKLKELDIRKNEFIALASHELKSPLTSMSAYLQIIAKKITDESIKQLVEKAKAQAENLNCLIMDLLDVSKMEAGKLAMNFEEFDIRQLVEQAIDSAASSNTDFNIILHTDILLKSIIGDRQRIEQVLNNLLSNAVRYSANSNQIEVYVRDDNNFITIGVKDYGFGIESKNHEHIFSRFYRAENTGHISGLGLGLYICHQIATQHQGKIWVESEVSKGSTFWLKLPVTHY